jgi:hypothetical protein
MKMVSVARKLNDGKTETRPKVFWRSVYENKGKKLKKNSRVRVRVKIKKAKHNIFLSGRLQEKGHDSQNLSWVRVLLNMVSVGQNKA